MGLRGNLPIFIGNFFSDRTFQVHLGTVLSDKIFHQESVPQGTVLSTTFIRDAFIQNQHLVTVFFDLRKAYDTTWKHGIQQDLHDMGLRGNLPIFIGNFLTDRTFQIHLGTILSDVFHQKEGVPQGAILSTTLFSVKINDIVKQVDPGVECSLYVDDFVIMYKSPTIDAIQRKLPHTIKRLDEWTLKSSFTIFSIKTSDAFLSRQKCMDPVLKL